MKYFNVLTTTRAQSWLTYPGSTIFTHPYQEMHTILNRGNAVMCYSLTVLLTMLAGSVTTTFWLHEEPIINITRATVQQLYAKFNIINALTWPA